MSHTDPTRRRASRSELVSLANDLATASVAFDAAVSNAFAASLVAGIIKSTCSEEDYEKALKEYYLAEVEGDVACAAFEKAESDYQAAAASFFQNVNS